MSPPSSGSENKPSMKHVASRLETVDCQRITRRYIPVQNFGLKVLIAMGIKTRVFSAIIPFSPVKFRLHFVGRCRLHLHGRRIRRARNHHDTDDKQRQCSQFRMFMAWMPVCVYSVFLLSCV
jgi:hypothetical protein